MMILTADITTIMMMTTVVISMVVRVRVIQPAVGIRLGMDLAIITRMTIIVKVLSGGLCGGYGILTVATMMILRVVTTILRMMTTLVSALMMTTSTMITETAMTIG